MSPYFCFILCVQYFSIIVRIVIMLLDIIIIGKFNINFCLLACKQKDGMLVSSNVASIIPVLG